MSAQTTERSAARQRTPRLTDSQIERAYVKYGADVANDVLAMIDRTQAPGWALATSGLPILDRLVTIAPQTVTVFAGRPQHGKSLWLKILAKRALAAIENGGGYERGERVFYVTLEEPGSKLGVQLGGMAASYRDLIRGEADVEAARTEATYLAKSLRSLVVMEHPGLIAGAIAPAVSAGMVMRGVERIATDDGLRPTMILLDYLQLMRADGSEMSVKNKTEHVMAASNGAVRLSRTFNCPVIMAVQAGREVDKRVMKVPSLSDMQWASGIEQDADTVIGLWRPWVDHAADVRNNTADPVTIDGIALSITDSLMVMGIAKTRNDSSGGRMVAAHVDPVRFIASGITLSREDGWRGTGGDAPVIAAGGETW